MMQRGWACLVAIGLGLVIAGPSQALPSDYVFNPVATTLSRGVGVTFRIEIRERSQNRLVPGVEIQDPRVDRSPDGMANANLPAFFAPSHDYGIYAFRADLPTDGNWALTFLAKIPGEPQPVPARVVLSVVEPTIGKAPAPAGSRQQAQRPN